MSLDYPYYEELCRRKHRAAWWWLVGDRLYSLGLIMVVFGVTSIGPLVVGGLLGFGWQRLWASVVGVIGGLVGFVVGASLKDYAYTLGERAGISAREVYERGSAPRPATEPDPSAARADDPADSA